MLLEVGLGQGTPQPSLRVLWLLLESSGQALKAPGAGVSSAIYRSYPQAPTPERAPGQGPPLSPQEAVAAKGTHPCGCQTHHGFSGLTETEGPFPVLS